MLERVKKNTTEDMLERIKKYHFEASVFDQYKT